jgi:hypothetical protein
MAVLDNRSVLYNLLSNGVFTYHQYQFHTKFHHCLHITSAAVVLATNHILHHWDLLTVSKDKKMKDCIYTYPLTPDKVSGTFAAC